MRNEVVRLIEQIQTNNIVQGRINTPQHLNNNELSQIIDALSKNQIITAINITGSRISVPGMKKIAEMLRANKMILHLGLRTAKLENEHMASLLEGLNDNNSLTSLDLSDNDLDIHSIRELAATLGNKPSIRHLNLRYNSRMGDASVAILAKLLKENHNLASLELASNGVTENGLKAIIDSLATNKALTKLALIDCNITSEAAKQIEQALLQNHHLRTLDISRNEIGNEGAYYVANILRYNRSLTALSINNCLIMPEGIRAIAAAMKINTSLVTLDMRENETDEVSIWGKRNSLYSLLETLSANMSIVALGLEGGRLTGPILDLLQDFKDSHRGFYIHNSSMQIWSNLGSHSIILTYKQVLQRRTTLYLTEQHKLLNYLKSPFSRNLKHKELVIRELVAEQVHCLWRSRQEQDSPRIVIKNTNHAYLPMDIARKIAEYIGNDTYIPLIPWSKTFDRVLKRRMCETNPLLGVIISASLHALALDNNKREKIDNNYIKEACDYFSMHLLTKIASNLKSIAYNKHALPCFKLLKSSISKYLYSISVSQFCQNDTRKVANLFARLCRPEEKLEVLTQQISRLISEECLIYSYFRFFNRKHIDDEKLKKTMPQIFDLISTRSQEVQYR